MIFREFLLELMIILMFLTGAAVLDDVCMVCTCPEGVMFKIWLKSDAFEGIKNSHEVVRWMGVWVCGCS